MNVMKTLIPALACALLAMPAVAADRGVNEVSGSLSYNDIEDVTLTTLAVSYGRYLTPMHELGLTASYLELEAFDESLDGTELGAFYHLNFDNGSTMVPYVGVNVATIGGDLGDAYDFAYGLSAGLKLYPYEHVGVQMSVAYQKLQAAEDYLDDVDGTSVNVGLSVRF